MGTGLHEVSSCPRYMECIETKESMERVCESAMEGRKCGSSSGSGSFGSFAGSGERGFGNEITCSWLPGRRDGG